MTREEAIAWFENWLLDYYDIDDIPQELTAELAGIALAALRQQDHFREVTKKAEPLNLDELRRMEGQPVYIVENTEYWAIVNSFDQAGVYLLSYGNPDDYGYFGLYGKTWLAYRQKPEEWTV